MSATKSGPGNSGMEPAGAGTGGTGVPRSVQLGLAAALGVALTLATAALSRVPVTFNRDDAAMLRLAWRTQGAVLESCRELSPEELAELPVHMRNPQACIGQLAPYVLTVRVDDATLVSDTLRAAGARHDRPMSVLRDLPLSTGEHRLELTFRAVLPEGAEVEEGSVTEMSWAGPVVLGSREVALVTLDASGGALELRTPDDLPPPGAFQP